MRLRWLIALAIALALLASQAVWAQEAGPTVTIETTTSTETVETVTWVFTSNGVEAARMQAVRVQQADGTLTYRDMTFVGEFTQAETMALQSALVWVFSIGPAFGVF